MKIIENLWQFSTWKTTSHDVIFTWSGVFVYFLFKMRPYSAIMNVILLKECIFNSETTDWFTSNWVLPKSLPIFMVYAIKDKFSMKVSLSNVGWFTSKSVSKKSEIKMQRIPPHLSLVAKNNNKNTFPEGRPLLLNKVSVSSIKIFSKLRWHIYIYKSRTFAENTKRVSAVLKT